MGLNVGVESGFLTDWAIRRKESGHISPRITELPLNVSVEGFSTEREPFVRRLVESIGLPLNNVSSIVFRENQSGRESVAGSVHMLTGELSFYKRMEGLPEIAQLGVAVHELAHENDPTNIFNTTLYGSKERMAATAENVRQVASQALRTGRYLNGYHRLLYSELISQNIDKVRFFQETHAIMLELRFTNPKHLEEVLRAQNPETADQILENLDKTLLALMPNLKNREELNQHIEDLRNSYKKTVSE